MGLERRVQNRLGKSTHEDERISKKKTCLRVEKQFGMAGLKGMYGKNERRLEKQRGRDHKGLYVPYLGA